MNTSSTDIPGLFFPRKFLGVTSIPENFKFRNNEIQENDITSFNPFSDKFHDSINSSNLKYASEAKKNTQGYGQYVGYLYPTKFDNIDLSVGLQSALKEVDEGTALTTLCYSYNSNSLVISNMWDNETTVVASLGRTKSKVNFVKLIKILLSIGISTDKSVNNSIRSGSFMNISNAYLSNKGFFCRLINIFEDKPGQLYCLSYLQGKASEPALSTIVHIWFQKSFCEDSVSINNIIPYYYFDGLLHTISSIYLSYLGIKLDRLGYGKLNFSIENKTYTVDLDNNTLLTCGYGGYGYFSGNNISSFFYNLVRSANCSRVPIKEIWKLEKFKPIDTSYVFEPGTKVFSDLPSNLQFYIKELMSSCTVNPTVTLSSYRQGFLNDVIESSPALRDQMLSIKKEALKNKILTDSSSKILVANLPILV